MDTDRALAAIGAGGRRGPVVGHLVRKGLVDDREAAILSALLEAGRLGVGARLLATGIRRRSELMARLQTRMLLPAAIWVIAMLIAPLPAWISGELTAGGYLRAVLMPAIATAGLVGAALRFWRPAVDALRDLALRSGRPPGRFLRVALFLNLGHLLAAGLDAARALQTLADAETGRWGRRLQAAAVEIADGAAVVRGLLQHGVVEPHRDGPVLTAGEAAGRLPESLLHQAGLLGQALDLRHETVVEWLPRIVYFLILIHLAQGFF